MRDSWKFDETFLRDTIRKANKLLKTKNNNELEYDLIQTTIEQFEYYLSLLTKKQEDILNTTRFYYGTQVDMILKKFSKIGKIIPNNFMCWLHELSQEKTNISLSPSYSICTEQSMDIIAKNSLEVYRDYLPIFYKDAKKMVEHPQPLFHCDNNDEIESECFYSDFLNLPFILFNLKDGEESFIHELQHGIEFVRNLNTNLLYSELGPMVCNNIYVDNFYPYRKKQFICSYEREILDVNDYLFTLSSCYCILKELEDKCFLISANELFGLFQKYNFCYKDSLNDTFCDFITNDIFEDFTYLFSFLKSISVCEHIYEDLNYGIKDLYQCFNEHNFSFFDSQRDMFDCYYRYVEQLKQKQKSLYKK